MVLNKARLALFAKTGNKKKDKDLPKSCIDLTSPPIEVEVPVVLAVIEDIPAAPISQKKADSGNQTIGDEPGLSGGTRYHLDPDRRLSVTILPSPTTSISTFASIDTMAATPPRVFNDLPLTLFVLLPSSGPATTLQPTPMASITRPPPASGRQSGSTVTTLSNLAKVPQEADEDGSDKSHSPDMSNMVAANRRLSLAPGMGSGTQTKSPKLGGFSITPMPKPTNTAASERPGRSAAIQPLSSSTSPISPMGSKPTPLPFGQRSFSQTTRTESPESTSRGPSPTGGRSASSTGASSGSGAGPTSSAYANGGAPTFGAPAFEAPPFGGSRSGVPQRAMTGRKRPSTASAVPRAFNQLARGSMALPLGMGLGIGVSGKNRPGWEGDEVVGMLRTSGMEVTVIRHASHLPAILTPKTTSPSYSSFASSRTPAQSTKIDTGPPTPVILVPLSDSPSLPSLSLLLSQGTTPTAVCFQQDLLDRAKRTEEEWLPSAVAQIQVVTQMRDKAVGAAEGPREIPIILAYSANPTLSPSTIAACVNAGASGVLKPPYDLETARLVRRMAKAAKEGRLSSIVGMPAESDLPMPVSPNMDNGDLRVVLPPTALSMGDNEHEGERILATRHRRSTSGQWESPAHSISPPARGRDSVSYSATSSRKQSRQEISPLPPLTAETEPEDETATPAELEDEEDAAQAADAHPDSAAKFLVYHPALTMRRRSVDTGSLTRAMKRAQKAFESASAKPVPIHGLSGSAGTNASSTSTGTSSIPAARTPGMVNGFAFPGTPDRFKSPTSAKMNGATYPPALVNEVTSSSTDEVDTHLAELLGAMFYQTCLTINVQMEEYVKLSAPPSPAHRTRLIDALATWDFKPHRLDEGDLYRVACIIFEAINNIEGVKELALDMEKIKRLLFAIRAIYHAPNPYHNYVHAIDVLQATYSFLMDIGVVPQWKYLRTLTAQTPAWTRPDEAEMPVGGFGTRRAREVLRPQDVLAVIVAAMGHDVGHPGLSNAFMKNAKTPLSEVYDDKSVLENMHCMLVVQLMRKHGFGFLTSSLEAARDPDTARNPARQTFDSKGFRKVLYSSVLVTDMSLHFAWIGRLKELGERVEREQEGTANGVEEDKEVESDRIMLCQTFMKCADISNPTRPINTSEHWSTVLLEEWAKQASLETDLALPVSVVASADQALQAKGQIGFIDLFTHPLFEAAADVIPELQPYSNSCATNREIWSGRLEKLQAYGETALVQPVIANASIDERFRTLFPLSLPTSLVSITCLEPGPLPASFSGTPTNSTFSNSISSNSTMAPSTPIPIKSPAIPTTPLSPASTTGLPASPSSASFSPAAKAMRAVYHANLLEQRHRLSSVSRGIPIPGVDVVLMDAGRRASTPDGLTVHLHEHGRFDRQYLRT